MKLYALLLMMNFALKEFSCHEIITNNSIKCSWDQGFLSMEKMKTNLCDFFFSHLSFYFCERVQRRALIQVRLEAFEADLSLDEVIQTEILNI